MGVTYGIPPFLQLFPGARIAYSLRPLNGNPKTNLLRVRRESDDATIDVSYLDLQNGVLELFCAGTNGRVNIWYDQSGNGYNMTQSTTTNQPKIVTSGVIDTENGKHAISFNGTSQYLTKVSIGASTEYPLTTIAVFNRSNSNESICRCGSGADRGAFGSASAYTWHNNYFENNILRGTTGASFTGAGTQVIGMGFGLPSDAAIISNLFNGTFDIGIDVPSYDYLTGTLQEFIVYPSNQVEWKNRFFNTINSFYKVT